MAAPVCITGATGFVGSHIVDAFLEAGVPVRAAVRSPDDPDKTGHLIEMAQRHGTELTFHGANLAEPGSFDQAIQGCEGVIHTAASVRLAAPDPQKQIVDPSINGTRNVLGACTKAGIRRVVMTSSVAALGNYRASQDHPLSEADWNDAATLQTDPYGLAKCQAERLAWSMSEEAGWDLVVCNPSLVLGPVFNKRHCAASPATVGDILKRAFPANPRICFGIVDARDVAQAHLAAYQRPDAQGRHVLAAGTLWMRDIAVLLDGVFPERRLKTRTLPNLLMRIGARFDQRLDPNVLSDLLGRVPHYDGNHAVDALGISYRDVDSSVIDTAKSMIESGLIR